METAKAPERLTPSHRLMVRPKGVLGAVIVATLRAAVPEEDCVSLWKVMGVMLVTLAGALVIGRAPHAQSGQARLAFPTGQSLRASDLTVDGMVRRHDLQLRRRDVDPVLPRRTHDRLTQYHRGIPVYGGDVTRQSESGSTISMFGAVYEHIDIDTTAAISVDQAAAIIAQDSGVDLGPLNLPALTIVALEGRYRLLYRAKVFTLAGGTEYVVDATTGAIVDRLDAVQRQAAVGRGTGVLNDTKKMSTTETGGVFTASDPLRPPSLQTFDMKGNLQRTIDFLNNRIQLSAADRAVDTDGVWTDQATVDAHAYAGYTYDYYYKRFGRKGLDNNNLRLLSVVHPAVRADYASQSAETRNSYYRNAGYYGSGVMLYGEGLPPGQTFNGQSWNYLAGALDVVGHELTHGVTDYTSHLIYAGESGALNESFSDMMGTAIEFFYQSAGNGPLRADYLIGEDVVTPGGIRSMANPLATGDPDHYSLRSTSVADNGGVHTNSGIGNQWYYLAIEGGINRTSGLSVTGVGPANREQIERVAYRAFTLLMPSNATYAVARAVTIQAARDLYGINSNAERAVTQAWTAVGVN